MSNEPVGDRRPIASRELAISQRSAQFLARRGVSANSISVGGMICGIGAGTALLFTGCRGGACPNIVVVRVLLLLSAARYR